jgi:hypothetical protein
LAAGGAAATASVLHAISAPATIDRMLNLLISILQ